MGMFNDDSNDGQSERVIQGERVSVLGQAKMRLVMVALLLLLGYTAISLRLVDLTLLRSKPIQQVALLEGDVKPLDHPLRGTILDRNGELIATSLAMASVYADTTIIDNKPQLAKQLSQILQGQSEADLLRKLTSGKKFIWIERNITPKQEYAINALGQPGLSFQEEDRRIYPGASLTSHLIGYTDVDGHGISGIEKFANKQLEKGDKPVKLTIDLRIQHIMHRELEASVAKFHAKAGVGIVMDVNTGEIIAMVSLPDFDPHHPGDSPDDAKFNRATLGVFEMGSTFKLFSSSAALDSGKVTFASNFDAAEPIHYGRFTITDYHAKKRVLSVPEIFIYSSNIGTARMAASLGGNTLQDFYKSLGFFTPVPVELPERGQPLYPSPWRDISTLTCSFGHGIAVSPLHVIRATSALVNGGILVTPTLLEKDNESLSLTPQGTRVIKPQTSQMIRQLMALNVADGSGAQAAVDGYNVGGKTGTAEKNKGGRYEHNLLLSSFMGAYPIGNPRYAVLAILDEPKGIPETHGFATAGWTAAPVVARVVEQMAPLYHITPEADSRRDIIRDLGMYLKEFKEGKSLAATGYDR
ncbi:MAG: penicillin-binding protein 2 [Micavibrio sp.]|nr:penicillin-binding protein 2 [Micavibrio sp.]